MGQVRSAPVITLTDRVIFWLTLSGKVMEVNQCRLCVTPELMVVLCKGFFEVLLKILA